MGDYLQWEVLEDMRTCEAELGMHWRTWLMGSANLCQNTVLNTEHRICHRENYQGWFMKKIAPSGRWGHLWDRKDSNFCDREKKGTCTNNVRKKFGILSLSPSTWIDLNISRRAPPQRLLLEIEKYDDDRLCGLMYSIILPSSSSIAWEL